ncbi:hypothetical protein Q7A53_16460 [Halobacillus rhizosphaerae]|uniref:hypothetical protein n=1 Tax=Halobacillus rhizosphaerae TaxID=3064889 RepID=UPI00398AEA1B
MERKTVANLLIFLIGGLLFTFSIELPVIGFKKLEFMEETSIQVIIDYNWYGKEISERPFKGDPHAELSLFRKQEKIQKLQVLLVVFAIMPLALWWSREKKRYIYGSAFIFFLLVIMDMILIHRFS